MNGLDRRRLVAAVLGGGAPATPLLLNNIAGAAVAVSTRLLDNTYTGKCLKLRRGSDDAELDFGFVAGELDIAAIATWLGAESGYVTTWYDQSGNNRNLTQTTPGAQPLYVPNIISGHPVIRFDATDDAMSVPGITQNLEKTISVIWKTAWSSGGISML